MPKTKRRILRKDSSRKARLEIKMATQPDDVTCGPTCLHSVYSYFKDPISLSAVIKEVQQFRDGGTLAVWLACHALRRGYSATLHTFNIQVFDPSWFKLSSRSLIQNLRKQAKAKKEERLRVATQGYLSFLELGGRLSFEALSPQLVRHYLNRGLPILTGLSSTYLYSSKREIPRNSEPDDIRGEPVGHFVVLSGYNKPSRLVRVADPYRPNPISHGQYYDVTIPRLICSILLGVVTYDANMLVIFPKRLRKGLP